MKIFTPKTSFVAASLWLMCLPQAVLASSQYNASIDFSYTITASNPNLNPDLLFLSVASDLQLNPALESASSTYHFSHEGFVGFGLQRNISLQAQDGITSATAVSDYFSRLLLIFENTSTDTNDVADIHVDFNYRLSAQANAADTQVDFADVEASLTYSNENFSVEGFDVAHASSQFGGFAEQTGSGAFDFVLAAGSGKIFTSTARLEVNSKRLWCPYLRLSGCLVVGCWDCLSGSAIGHSRLFEFT